jgi:hypothetical protein
LRGSNGSTACNEGSRRPAEARCGLEQGDERQHYARIFFFRFSTVGKQDNTVELEACPRRGHPWEAQQWRQFRL